MVFFSGGMDYAVSANRLRTTQRNDWLGYLYCSHDCTDVGSNNIVAD